MQARYKQAEESGQEEKGRAKTGLQSERQLAGEGDAGSDERDVCVSGGGRRLGVRQNWVGWGGQPGPRFRSLPLASCPELSCSLLPPDRSARAPPLHPAAHLARLGDSRSHHRFPGCPISEDAPRLGCGGRKARVSVGKNCRSLSCPQRCLSRSLLLSALAQIPSPYFPLLPS